MALQFSQSFELEIPEPFALVVGNSLFDTMEEQNCYLIKVLGGFTRLRAGFATTANVGLGDEFAAFYWVKIGFFYPDTPQVLPIPVWAGNWRYALQFVPTKYPCEAPHLRIYCP